MFKASTTSCILLISLSVVSNSVLGQSVQVEIQINCDLAAPPADNPNDDYLTWGPTFCRARLQNSSADITVVLTNDNPSQIPNGGNVVFAEHVDPWPYAATATSSTVSLNLRSDGSWEPFVIAGKFGSPSHNDKDTIIEAREGSAAGSKLGEKAMMVRVRKDANSMEADERNRFLDALRQFRNRTTNGYLQFAEMHRLATTAGDEAHNQPAFYPWHRTMLLHVERELQKIDSSVTIPYWDWDNDGTNIFTADFMGAVDPTATGFIAEPLFSDSNPLQGWDTDLPFRNGALIRNFYRAHGNAHLDGWFRPLNHPVAQDLVQYQNFSQTNLQISQLSDITSFSVAGELLSHNSGHSWPCGGGHLLRPMRSASDPLFYLLHSQCDRQWAFWQTEKNRFGSVVGTNLIFPSPDTYDNQGKFDDPGNIADPDIRQKGAFLDDGMWPWDGTSGGASLTAALRPLNNEPPRETGAARNATNQTIGMNDIGTLQLRPDASAIDDFYVTYRIYITTGPGTGENLQIVSYDGATKTAILNGDWETLPTTESTYLIDSENIPGSELSIPMSPFPASGTKNLWPGGLPIIPKPKHMIDYLGRFNPKESLGFCYEDVPYSLP